MRRSVVVGLVAPLCLALPGLPAAAPPSASTHRITVSATREVTPAPDRARVWLAIERTSASAEQAAEAVAKASERVVEAARRLVEKNAGVATRRYSLDPQYATPQPKDPQRGEPHIVGYRCYNEVEVETAKLDGLGALIDAAVANGANRVAGLVLEVADPAPFQRQALEEATREAGRQAQAIAAALGVKLGPVVEATTEPVEFPIPRPILSASLARAAAETPVLPGTVTIRSSVRLSYEIGQ